MGDGDWLDLLDDKLLTPARQAAARDSGDNSNAEAAATPSVMDAPAAPAVMPASSDDVGAQTLDTSSHDVAPRAPVNKKAARRGSGDAINIRIALSRRGVQLTLAALAALPLTCALLAVALALLSPLPTDKMAQVCDAAPAAAVPASPFPCPPQPPSSTAGVTWQVLHGSPPLDASSPVALRPPAVPQSAFGIPAPLPVVYTLAFWHIEDASHHDTSCGDWSALLLRGRDDSDRAPGIFLHRERFLHLRHASLDDVNVGIHATHACGYARRAWHHTALVVNRTSMVY
jgi:hypothetical protein